MFNKNKNAKLVLLLSIISLSLNGCLFDSRIPDRNSETNNSISSDLKSESSTSSESDESIFIPSNTLSSE